MTTAARSVAALARLINASYREKQVQKARPKAKSAAAAAATAAAVTITAVTRRCRPAGPPMAVAPAWLPLLLREGRGRPRDPSDGTRAPLSWPRVTTPQSTAPPPPRRPGRSHPSRRRRERKRGRLHTRHFRPPFASLRPLARPVPPRRGPCPPAARQGRQTSPPSTRRRRNLAQLRRGRPLRQNWPQSGGARQYIGARSAHACPRHRHHDPPPLQPAASTLPPSRARQLPLARRHQVGTAMRSSVSLRTDYGYTSVGDRTCVKRIGHMLPQLRTDSTTCHPAGRKHRRIRGCQRVNLLG